MHAVLITFRSTLGLDDLLIVAEEFSAITRGVPEVAVR